MPRQTTIFILTLLLLTTTLHAQTPPDRLQTALTRAAAAEAALTSSLPSFTCKEDVLSNELEGKKSRIRRHVAFTADIRVERRPDGELRETFEPASWAAILAQSGGIGIPYYVSGGFQSALIYFNPSQSACYRFQLAPNDPNRIDFAAAPNIAQTPGCKDEPGLTGFALLDPAGDIIHLERRVPADLTRRTNLATFAAIDIAPITLNGHTYRLSTHVTSDGRPGPTHGHFEATYTACHLFHTTVTIEPSAQPMPDTPPSR